MSINLDAFVNTMEQRCPECGAKLDLTRVEDLTVAEYRAHCPGCGFENIFRLMRCGGCHGQRFFRWVGGLWRCVRCGHVHGNASPPRL